MTALALLTAGLIFFFALLSRYRYLCLPELKGGASTLAEDLCVVIPARDEESGILQAVRSFPGSLTMVIDDYSTDATADLARQAGAEVRQAQPLPPKWLGKSNACFTGAALTDSRWLLFVDADTWYEPEFLPALLDYAASHHAHAVSVLPGLQCRSWAEKLLLPYAFGIYFTGVDSMKVNGSSRGEALANGQCLLCLRKAYDFVGGHKAVAGTVIEDVALARLFKRNRLKVRLLRCESLAHARMYGSFAALWRGCEKNSLRIVRANRKSALLAAAASLVMACWLPQLALLLMEPDWIPAGLFFFVPMLAWRPWYGSFARAAAAPLAFYLFDAILLSSLIKRAFGMKTTWKGRRV